MNAAPDIGRAWRVYADGTYLDVGETVKANIDKAYVRMGVDSTTTWYTIHLTVDRLRKLSVILAEIADSIEARHAGAALSGTGQGGAT